MPFSLRFDQHFFLAILVIVGLLFPWTPAAITNIEPEVVFINKEKLTQVLANSPTLDLPFVRNTSVPLPFFSAKSIFVIDQTNGHVLFDRYSSAPLPTASLTKIMTAIISVEQYGPDEIITINGEEETDGNRIKLVKDEKISVANLLKGLLIFSGNDAAMALANHHPGGYEAFVQAMNKKAQSLGMENTSFINPAGLDDPQQLSTAKDLALLMKAALSYSQLKEILGTQYTLIESVDKKYQHHVYTTNQLLGKMPGITAGKTGSTDLAGECLITQVNRDGHPIITVILGSEARFNETESLVEWIFNTYHWQQIKHQTTPISLLH